MCAFAIDSFRADFFASPFKGEQNNAFELYWFLEASLSRLC